jgi:hypothetical protein
MVRCRLFLLLLAPLLLHADVTLRYKTEVKMNPTLPAPMTAAMGARIR